MLRVHRFQGSEEDIRYPGVGVMMVVRHPTQVMRTELCPLLEQQALLTIEPSLQSLHLLEN